MPLPSHSCVPVAHIFLPTHPDTWIHTGTLPEEADLGKVYPEESVAVLLAKPFSGEGPRLPQRRQAPCGTSQASHRYLLAL